MNDLDKMLNFLRIIEKLKTIERFNKTSNLNRAESDAEHIWHMLMMAYFLKKYKPNLNFLRIVELILVHDLVEVYAGDVNLWESSDQKVKLKKKNEFEAAELLASHLPKEDSEQMLNLWREYDESTTPEAQFVQAIDKIQPFLQRLTSKDSGWKEKKVSAELLKKIKPEEIINDPLLSPIWDSFIVEAKKNKLSYED